MRCSSSRALRVDMCRDPAVSRRNLEAEIAKNEEALAKATSIREKELAEFNAEEKDMLQSIGALKSRKRPWKRSGGCRSSFIS